VRRFKSPVHIVGSERRYTPPVRVALAVERRGPLGRALGARHGGRGKKHRGSQTVPCASFFDFFRNLGRTLSAESTLRLLFFLTAAPTPTQRARTHSYLVDSRGAGGGEARRSRLYLCSRNGMSASGPIQRGAGFRVSFFRVHGYDRVISYFVIYGFWGIMCPAEPGWASPAYRAAPCVRATKRALLDGFGPPVARSLTRRVSGSNAVDLPFLARTVTSQNAFSPRKAQS
jgi:hypothetical protein